MHELDVEVETLDLSDDLDVSRLKEPVDRFSERLGAWRTALALSADPAPPVNLMPRDVGVFRSAPGLNRRLGAAVAAGLLIAAAGWGLVTYLSGNATVEQQRLRRLVVALEPEMQRQAEARRHTALAAARRSALRAMASQGPRLARVLEAFSRAAPADIALTAFTVEPGIGYWRITAEGQAEGADAAAAQATFNRFLKALSSSPVLGNPITPVSLRVRTADPDSDNAAKAAEPPPPSMDPPPLEVQERRTAPAGPAYIDVARDGRLYRIPLRRQTGDVELDRQKNVRRRQQLEASSAGARLTLGLPATADPEGRHPASVLDFTVHYEVRK
jgi:hypothetical protein